MKNLFLISLMPFVFFTVFSCRKSDGKPSSTEIGVSSVDLDANEVVIRKKEALLGNLICDALMTYFIQRGEQIDFALINGGNIRFNSQNRPDGIYKAGMITSEMVDEMLPFTNSSYIVQLTGYQLKQILERSVAQYPLAKGPFLQCSKEIRYKIDSNAVSQVVNIEETEILSNGSRVDSIFINNETYSPNTIYKVLFSDYIAEGNDGFVTLKKINKSLKKYLSDNQTNALKDYIIVNSPIEPKLENRIYFK
jgi:2',3'-cyclic-nucleotide 2'-phosphodiesterase (5'-nucleotidase family)